MDIEEHGTEQHQTLEQEEQIMIMIDGLEDNEEDQDLLEQLVAEPPCEKKRSSNYDYLPAPHQPQRTEEGEAIELKTSSTSTATSGDVEVPVRRCLCEKTRCLKNYCEMLQAGSGLHQRLPLPGLRQPGASFPDFKQQRSDKVQMPQELLPKKVLRVPQLG